MQQILTYTFLVLYSVTILGIVLVIITDNRNPLKTLPWIIVLVLAPVVGLVFYFFFGQNLSKQRIISRRMRKRITLQLEEAEHAAGPEIPKAYRPLARLLRTASHAVPLYGSRITPYTDGSSKMEALLGEIARARHHIHLQYYIFCDDETGRRLRDALVEKARQGVHVRILYDDVGCSGVSKSFFEGMRREGIEVHAFLHVKFPRFTSKVNYRNHRKIVVIDGRVGFIGGMNIADRYVRGTEWGSWRDTHFRIEGSGVAGLQVAFLSDWSATTKRHVSGSEYFPAAQRYTDNILQIVAGGPLGKWRALLQVRFPMLTDRVNYRNHRKIVVIDGRVGFFGGMNIADRYVKGPGWGVWRDSHFKVEGKGVYGLQSAFLVDWSTVERVHLDTSKFFPEADNYTSSTMQFATSGPLGPWRTLLQGIMTAIAGARRSICIQTPYFLPTEGLNSLLQTAALGGIDVQLMLPERSDSRIIDKAVHSFIDDMLRAGVKVYFYTKGFLHAKMLIVDDLLTVVGSANMDFRSFEHNFEINAFVYGQDFNTAMRRVFDEDLRSCRRLIPSEWLRRPLPQRLSESFMRLFSPLL